MYELDLDWRGGDFLADIGEELAWDRDGMWEIVLKSLYNDLVILLD